MHGDGRLLEVRFFLHHVSRCEAGFPSCLQRWHQVLCNYALNTFAAESILHEVSERCSSDACEVRGGCLLPLLLRPSAGHKPAP